MDMDDFLEKEIQIKKGKYIESEHLGFPVAKEEKEVIQHYSELLSKISKSKLIWDKNTYDKITAESKKVKERLNRVLTNLEKEKETIKDLIFKANNELINENHEAALRLYSEINNMQEAFPNFLLEEKRELNNEIFQLYERLHEHLDRKFIKDFKDVYAKVSNFIHNSYSNFKNGDIVAAEKFYNLAIRSYRNLPSGFLFQKLELGNGILILYKNLSTHPHKREFWHKLGKKHTVGHESAVKNMTPLSKSIKNKFDNSNNDSVFSDLMNISKEKQQIQNKTLLPRLIERKLDRAKINLRKQLYSQAKENVESVLKVDPNNKEAKQILKSIPFTD